MFDKRRILYILGAIVLIVFWVPILSLYIDEIRYLTYKNNGINIDIENKTNSDIEQIEFIMNTQLKETSILTINVPKGDRKKEFIPIKPNTTSEGSIHFTYDNKENKKVNHTAIGYVPNFNGKTVIKINIEDIDSKGNLTFTLETYEWKK